jgi:hypothetical protein
MCAAEALTFHHLFSKYLKSGKRVQPPASLCCEAAPLAASLLSFATSAANDDANVAADGLACLLHGGADADEWRD